jgi:FKBP-type peptidyl-prolyl cis-trans isomerase SlyD
MAIERIANGVVVSIAYSLSVDGAVLEQVDADVPLEYLHGAENIVPGLEAQLTGKKVGDTITVTLSPEEAYGEYDDENIETIDRAELEDSDKLEPGLIVEVEDENGFFFEATILEVTDTSIVLDFNPPLAGKAVTYTVEVLALREAEEEELEHGHPHSLQVYDFELEDGDYDDEYDE